MTLYLVLRGLYKARFSSSTQGDPALPLIKETSKSLLKETKRDHLLKEKETIKRPFLKRKETFKFFMRYFDRMEENCGKNVHCGYFCQLS